MTPDERKMLEDLAARIAQTAPPQPDAEAEEFIRTRIGSRPDALYLMTQTVLIQNMALAHAQQQIQDLQQRASAPQPQPPGGSFLGQAGPQSWQPVQQPPQAPPPPAPPSAGSGWLGGRGGGGGASSFLHSAATTAAGVAAGALAFEGLRSLFSGHSWFGGGPLQSGFLGGGGGLFGGAPGGETVINNYYDSPEDRADADDRDLNDTGGDDTPQDYDDSDYSDGGDGGSDDSGGFDDGSSGGDDLV